MNSISNELQWHTENKTKLVLILSYGHYTGQPTLTGTPSYEPKDLGGAKFYCPHALPDGK